MSTETTNNNNNSNNNNNNNNNINNKDNLLSDTLFFKAFRNVFLQRKILNNSYYIFDSSTAQENGDSYFETDKDQRYKRPRPAGEFSPYARQKYIINPSLHFININNTTNTNDNNTNINSNNSNNNNSNDNNTQIEKHQKMVLTGSHTDQVGAIWSKRQIPLDSSILIRFSFQISLPKGENLGADGFACVVQTESCKEYSTRYSGGTTLGYHGILKGKGAVAIEFDTYLNQDEPNGNHISIQTCSNLKNGKIGLSSSHKDSLACATPPNNIILKDGNIHHVEILFNKENSSLSVVFDSVEILSDINVPDLKDLDSAFIGFTSATGYFHSKHTILNCEVLKQ